MIDQYEPSPPGGWPRWMESQIRDATFVVVVCTETYLTRIEGKEERGKGLGVCWEAQLIYQHLYQSQGHNDKFIPIVLKATDNQFIPEPLRSTTRYDLDEREGYEQLYRRLTHQHYSDKPPLGKLKALPKRRKASDGAGAESQLVENPPSASQVEVMSLAALSPNIPVLPANEIKRDHIINTIESLLGRDIALVTIEGESGIGKSVLAAQFVRALPDRVISIFIRSASRLSYDIETIRLHLLDQVHWAVDGQRSPNVTFGTAELKHLYAELQRKARKQRGLYYFVVDGFSELQEHSSDVISSVLELLPLGSEYFKFLLTGDMNAYEQFLHKSIRSKSFPLVEFGLDETIKLFGGVSIVDRTIIADIHKHCRGLPGHINDVARLMESGVALSECLSRLTARGSHLFAFEWQKVNRKNDSLTRVLAVIAHDDKVHTIQTLAEFIEVSEDEIEAHLRPLSFVTIETDRRTIAFISESFRRFAADQLRPLKTWVHKRKVTHLLSSPQPGDDLVELAVYLTDNADFQHFLQYLTPQHIHRLLRKTHSLAHVQQAVDAGLNSAKRLGRDGDMLRFGIQQSLLGSFIAGGVGVAEAEALVSLGRFDAALTLANSALLREDRLHILAVIARGKMRKGRVVEPELIDQIRVSASQIDPTALGSRTIDIAAQLVCVDPQLALSLVDQAKPTDLERDQAFAKLSLFALETLGQEGSAEMIDTIRSQAPKGDVDLLMQSIAFLSRRWSVPELLAHIEQIARSRDKLFLIRAWLRFNSSTSVEIVEVVRYALGMAIQSDLPIDATTLLALAERLHRVSQNDSAAILVGMFDAHKGMASKVGPTVDYVRLQVALARCEARYDSVACENRLIGTFYEINQIGDIAVRTQAAAWLLDGVGSVSKTSGGSFAQSMFADVLAELDASFLALLDGTADHHRAAKGVLEALHLGAQQKPRSLHRC